MKLWKIEARKCRLHMIETALVVAPTAERAWELLSADKTGTHWVEGKGMQPYTRSRVRADDLWNGPQDLFTREHYKITELALTEEEILQEIYETN